MVSEHLVLLDAVLEGGGRVALVVSGGVSRASAAAALEPLAVRGEVPVVMGLLILEYDFLDSGCLPILVGMAPYSF